MTVDMIAVKMCYSVYNTEVVFHGLMSDVVNWLTCIKLVLFNYKRVLIWKLIDSNVFLSIIVFFVEFKSNK